ncbi:MAG: pilin [Patescibacteria group bacterium]
MKKITKFNFNLQFFTILLLIIFFQTNINIVNAESCSNAGGICYITVNGGKCPNNYTFIQTCRNSSGETGECCKLTTQGNDEEKPNNENSGSVINPPKNDCAGKVCLTNPLTGDTTNTPIPEFLGKIINGVLGIVGSLALVMFIYGGLLWMTSSGKADQVTKGRDSMLWAAIGIIVIFSAYALVNLVLTTITK